MSVPTFLVRLYPPAIRQRWGSEIAHEAHLAGPRSWPDTITGAARLWLHPSDWPETTTGQTRRVLATALVAVTTTAALLVRAASPGPLTANVDHPATSAWLAPILAGLACAAPLPRLSWVSCRRLAVATARTLVAPCLALLALIIVANSGLIDHPTGIVDVVLVGCYWTTLGFVGIHLCVLTARIGRIAVMPSTRRLHVALLFVGTGLVIAAMQSLTTTLQFGPVVVSCGLAALAATLLVAGLDLRSIPSGGSRSVADRLRVGRSRRPS